MKPTYAAICLNCNWMQGGFPGDKQFFRVSNPRHSRFMFNQFNELGGCRTAIHI